MEQYTTYNAKELKAVLADLRKSVNLIQGDLLSLHVNDALKQGYNVDRALSTVRYINEQLDKF